MRRVWFLHCIGAMSPAQVTERLGCARADVDRVLAGLDLARWVTREALLCIASREFVRTNGSSTVYGLEHFVEQGQTKLRELLRRTPKIPWDRVDALHVEQFGRLLIHATLRTSLEKQLDALRSAER